MQTVSQAKTTQVANSAAPRVSVVMPVYNCGPYVAATVQSILAQTLTDFEFIIIDDGSTDNTQQVVQRFAEQDQRIRLISRPNQGFGPTLEQGVAMARGEFIARIDGDDLAMPERFEKQVQAFDEDASLAERG